jgi:hypothetical protein
LVTADPDLAKLAIRMAQLDDRIRTSREEVDLFDVYRALRLPRRVIKQFQLLRRADTDVYFNFRRDGVCTLDSALINRLTTLVLMRAEIVTQIQGNLTVRYDGDGSGAGTATVTNGHRTEKLEHFDVIVMRHGETSAEADKRLLVDPDKLGGVKHLCETLDDPVRLDEPTMKFWLAMVRATTVGQKSRRRR